MKLKDSIKAFVAGSFFPYVFLPFAYILNSFDFNVIRKSAIEFVPMFIPLLFGGANCIALSMGARSKFHY